MVQYKCNTCGKIFNHKSDYKKHLNRKKPCTKTTHNLHINKEQQVDDKNDVCTLSAHICEYCNKSYSRKYTLTRHKKSYCKVKKEEDSIITELLKEMDDMKAKMCKLENENKKLIINNNTQNNNNNNQINGNVNLVAFGKEDFSQVTDETMKKILKRGFKSLPLLFNNIHFNKNRPQYQNIHISNMRDNTVIVYDGTTWKLVDRHTTLDDIIERYEDVIERKYYELEDELDEFTIKKLDRFINEYCDKENIEMYKKDLTLLLYNNRKMVHTIEE